MYPIVKVNKKSKILIPTWSGSSPIEIDRITISDLGSVIVVKIYATGGDGYYEYRVDDGPWQRSSSVMVTEAGSLTAYVRDEFGNVASKEFTSPGTFGYTEDQIETFVATENYIPVGTHQDLNAVRANQVDRVWAAGTRWETTKSSTGLTDKYIQVADIDLYDECRTGGAYDNAGAGWEPIGNSTMPFSGDYNGGGHIINGLYINSTGSFVGLFSKVTGYVANIYLSAIEIYVVSDIYSYLGGICAQVTENGHINKCVVSGIIVNINSAQNPRIAGVVGDMGGAIFTIPSDVTNCISNVAIVSRPTSNSGGAIGQIRADCHIANIISIGKVNMGGGLVGTSAGLIEPSYYNTETSGRADVSKGAPKTTAQLLAGTPSAEIFTDWDTEIDAVTGKPVWQFRNGRYPILSIFGEMAANIPAPINLQVGVEGDSTVVIDWQDHPDAPPPKGYNVYQSIDNGAWEKINTNLITTKALYYEPTEPGEYNYFVKAVYYIRGFDQETGNSVTTVKAISENWFTYNGELWAYDEVVSPTGRVWMDRNLGAERQATAYNDALAYGDLFQWGRGDDGHQEQTSLTETEKSVTDTPGHDKFIITSVAPNDWRNPSNDNLWKNGINIPAPSGWKIPSLAEWQVETATWVADPDGRVTAYNSVLKIPTVGVRAYNTGIVGNIGTRGYYWSQDISQFGDAERAAAIEFRDTGIFNNTHHIRATGESLRLTKVQVGDEYQGGIVAHIFVPGELGYVEGEIHGMIFRPGSLGSVPWSNITDIAIGNTSDLIGHGKSNTERIIAQVGHTNSAAKLCNDLVHNGYSDWFLPNYAELSKAYNNLHVTGITTMSTVWSSFELNATEARGMFGSSGGLSINLKYVDRHTHACRYF